MSRTLPFFGLALLAGCATAPPPTVVSAPPPPPPAGMELLLNQLPETAVSLLGQPRLDKKEGASRQLQYVGGCVLDLWYYPKPGPALVAAHADARLPDGRDFAPGECLQLLIRSREAAKAAAAAVPPAPTPAPAAKKAPPRKRG